MNVLLPRQTKKCNFYIAHFDTNDILTELYVVKYFTQMHLYADT